MVFPPVFQSFCFYNSAADEGRLEVEGHMLKDIRSASGRGRQKPDKSTLPKTGELQKYTLYLQEFFAVLSGEHLRIK